MKLNRITLLVFFIFSIQFSFGQSDTTEVQVIQFSDGLDNRRAWRIFPPDTGSYRKILMYQTLKCDPSLIDNPTGSGCGEWDAGANFILYHHDNKDSLRYLEGGVFNDTVSLVSTPTYTSYQENQQFIVYNSTISESTFNVGGGVQTINETFNDLNANNRAQYLWTATELSSAGMSAGNIDKLELDLSAFGGSLDHLSIKMKHSGLNSLSEASYETNGFSTVYHFNSNFSVTGWNTINLTTPFNWDGVSNVVIEFSFNNVAPGTGHSVSGEITASDMGVHSMMDDGYLDFSGNGDYIDVPDMTFDFSGGYTISAWMYYDAYNSWSRIFDCYDDNLENGFQFGNKGGNNGLRIVAKVAGSGINVTADAVLNLNEWMHVAVTVDAGDNATIYVNGLPVASAALQGLGTLNLVNNFIARSNNESNGYFDGRMNDFQFWSTALSQTDLQNWMYKDIDPSHPSFSDLQLYYKMDDMTGTNPDDYTSNNYDGLMVGLPAWKEIPGEELNRNMVATNERPNLNLIQGIYTTSLDSIPVIDNMLNPLRSVIVSSLYRDINEVGLQSSYIDTMFGWAPGYSYTYDQNNVQIDSTWSAADDHYYNWYNDGNKRIARYITPYGNYLDLGAGFTWVYDLTHLEPWLHDTIDFLGGDQRELIDLRFEFIGGTPPRDVHSIEKVLTSESGKYEDIVIDPPTSTVIPNANSEMFGLRYSVTGHSFNNATNCAEFCARTHYFDVNGTRVYDWLHMKECATNPLYPQGGTWIYDRTGWCPGEAVDWFDLDLTSDVSPGVPVTLTYGVDPDPTGTEYGNWSREMFFISYSNPNFNLDAEVYDIVSPNSWEYYGRYNPICDNPVIEIRNSGATTLDSVEIQYGVIGGSIQSFMWTGSLGFMEVERVVLPMHNLGMWFGSSEFFAEIVNANGVVDDYSENDRYTTGFEAPPMMDENIAIDIKTNAAGNETSWDIRDGFGNVLYSGGGLSSNTTYQTPVTLPIGCYTLNVQDSGDDGLDFWNNNDGIGYCRIRNSLGQIVKTFEPDFGDNIHYQFSVGETVSLSEMESDFVFNIFPNPSSGMYNVQLKNMTASEAKLEIYNALGMKVFSNELNESDWMDSIVQIDLSEQASGIYSIQLSTSDGNFIKRIVKK
ncbi:MAG: peptide-N-glycosidase F-related protein [Crocinitomicaceae bacterium]|nr:peptide-N-glycosidase F-related protein [Crocinitomicaceae bacterium]